MRKQQTPQIPMMVPGIGGQPQMFDVSEAIMRPCESCGGMLFEQAVRLGVISNMAPKNRTGKDVLVQFPIFLCRGCGWEWGKMVEVKGATDE